MKRLFAIVLSFAMLLSTMALCVSAETPTPWNGTDVDTSWCADYDTATTFTISDAADLAGLASLVNDTTSPKDFAGKTIQLSADIDLNNQAWTPIGNDSYFFNGMFNGQGKTISNLNVTADVKQGLFGVMGDNSGKNSSQNTCGITNLKIENASVVGAASGKNINAILVGQIHVKAGGNFKYLFENIYVQGSIESARTNGANLGAICGQVGHLGTGKVEFKNIVVNATVKNSDSNKTKGFVVGGLIGIENSTCSVTIDHCVNIGNVSANTSANYSAAGGIVGKVAKDETSKTIITNCLNFGNITSQSYMAGGIGGFMENNAVYEASDCMNQGMITEGTGAVESSCGVFGKVDSDDKVVDCYNTTANTYAKAVSAASINNAFNGALDVAKALTDYAKVNAAVEKVIGAARVITMENGLVGIQQSAVTEGADPTFNVRFVAKVADTANKAAVGFMLTINEFQLPQDSTSVYTSINAIGSDGKLAKVTASDLGGAGLYALTLEEIPADETVTITVQTYTKATLRNAPTLVDTYELTFTNGVLTNCVVPTTAA